MLTFGEAPLPKLTRVAAFRNERRYGANKRLEMNELTGSLYVIRVPYNVASHLKILIPVGTAMIIVADVK